MKCFRYIIFLCFLLLSMGAVQNSQAETFFSTKRLSSIAERLELDSLDQLCTGTHIGIYSYINHPLVIRVNEWNEIEHIGFWVFRQDSQLQNNPLPVYDFIERYLLELNMPEELNPGMRLMVDKVYISGNLNAFLSFTGEEILNIQYKDLREYIVSWHTSGQSLLTISFDMDYQLMAGCNALELEYNLIRDISRFACHNLSSRHIFIDPDITSNTDYFIDKGERYLVDLVRNDLYYTKQYDDYELLYDNNKANQTIMNIMLTPYAKGDFQLDINVDLYGYKETNIKIDLKQWLCYCIDKGCIPFFGIKSKDEESLKGTIFMVNRKGGYNHIMSVVFPFENLSKGTGTIKARLFAYIPMHNLSDKFYLMN